MPFLGFYATVKDIPEIIEILNTEPEIAFIISTGKGQWKAVKELEVVDQCKYTLWHVPSGPLPLLGRSAEDINIPNPWAGWVELRAVTGILVPFFASHTGVIVLSLYPASKDPMHVCGFSSFDWVGNYYRIAGIPAHPTTEAYWLKLRKQIKKICKKVPRGSLKSEGKPEIYAFPDAYSQLSAGGNADINPTLGVSKLSCVIKLKT